MVLYIILSLLCCQFVILFFFGYKIYEWFENVWEKVEAQRTREMEEEYFESDLKVFVPREEEDNN